jgi:hypothetical protein
MTAPESGGGELNPQVDPLHKDSTQIPSSAPLPGLSLLDMDDGDLLEATGSPARPSRRKRRRVRKPSAQIDSQFSHPTKFDLLGGLDDEGVSAEHKQSNSHKPKPEPSSPEDMTTAPLAPDKPEVVLMPSFDTDFWRVYGNKLRVFGTKEEIFRLAA